MFTRKNLVSFVLLLAGFGIGWIVQSADNKPSTASNTSSQESVITNPTQETMVYIRNNQVLVTDNKIVFNEDNGLEDNVSFEITAEQYPNLFIVNSLDTVRIHPKEVEGSNRKDNGLIYIANQQPNHGTINDGYYVIVDPKLKKVVDTGWERLFGTVRLYSSCTSCALPLIEFKSYDRTNGKYSLANSIHRAEFLKLKSDLQTLNKSEKCRINGVTKSLSEVLETATDTDKCGDQGMGINTDKPSDEFITIGQYREILKNVDRIISGENIKAFERI